MIIEARPSVPGQLAHLATLQTIVLQRRSLSLIAAGVELARVVGPVGPVGPPGPVPPPRRSQQRPLSFLGVDEITRAGLTSPGDWTTCFPPASLTTLAENRRAAGCGPRRRLARPGKWRWAARPGRP